MKKLLLTLTAVIAGFFSARAGIVFSESFNYPDGQITTNTSVWVNNSGATPMLVSNQQLLVTFARAEDIAHQFVPGITNDGSGLALYASFKVTFNALPSQSGTYFTHFTSADGITFFRARVWAATTNLAAVNVAPPGFFHLGIGNSTPSGGVPVGPANGQLTTQFTTNVAYTVVTRYVLSTATSTIWVDPATEADPGATADDVIAPSNIGYYGFRQASGEGSMIIDDLKIGTAFTDVAGANTAPTISTIPNQNTPANSTVGPVAFTIQDGETPAGSLTLSADSSDQTLVPTANIVFGGSGSDRNVTITPAPGMQGSATITIIVSDGGNQTPTSFTLLVGAPSISPIPNQTVLTNQATDLLTFTISDAEAPASSLIVTATSSNPALVPETPVNLTLGGADAARTLTVTPAANLNGVATITVSVTDGNTTNSTSFILTVRPVIGLVFNDEFNYTTFQLASALYGATDSPWQHHSGNFYELQVADGQAELSGGLGEDLNALLMNAPFNPTDGWVLYTSFKLTYLDLPNTSSEYFLHLRDNGSGFRSCVVATTNGVAAGKYRLGIANQSANTSAKVLFPLDLEPNTAYTVVTRYNVASGASSLWVNPANESSTSANAADNPNLQSISTVALRQSGGIGTNHVDSLKVGTSFADVFSAVAPSPEPLNVHLAGGNVVLTWANPAFSLQAAPAVSGSYANIPGATSPYTNSATGERYFRLKF